MRAWPTSLLLGIGLLLVGAAPLLSVIITADLGMISDPNPNPIGPGLLFFATVWPALGLIAFGTVGLLTRSTEPSAPGDTES
jgi:hypothetical protein